jgi:glycosyltransferase involved in cell wall biosynthesis
MIRVGFCHYVLDKGLRSGTLDGIGQYTRALGEHLTHDPLSKQISLKPFTYGQATNGTITMGHHALNSLWSSVTGKNFWGSQALQQAVDVIHATDHHIPCCAPTPVVATIMDVIPLSHPEWVRDDLRSLKNAVWKKSLAWADQLITISEYSKTEIIKWTDVPAEKIKVIPLGVDASWFERSLAPKISHIRDKYQLPEKFFISIGTLQPRKNIGSTLRAHQSLSVKERLQTPLIIVGRAGWKCETLIKLIEQDPVAGAVRWLQHVPQQDMPTLLQCARALVFPSLAEGFGLPILEAFASCVPVITAQSSCLPEVAGDAAMLIDPMDIAQLAKAMRRIRDDQVLADTLIIRGFQRARIFSWDACARATADIYINMAR